MHRRPVGRGRTLAVLSAIVMVVACILPWYGVGGGSGLPSYDFRAFDGSGILVFVAALATIALVALPYAAGDQPVSVDRWLAYFFLAVVAVIGVAIWPVDLLGDFASGLLPNRAPGFWLAIAGVIGLCRAVYDIARERRT